jgi:phenylacetate-CoA ligase
LEAQRMQLARVVEHAYRSVPFYRRRFDGAGLDPTSVVHNEGQWSQLPVLKRRDIQLAGRDLYSNEVPEAHGRVSESRTGGSTSQPVTTLGTDVTDLFWRALTLRDHLWHQRNLADSLAVIRYFDNDRPQAPTGITVGNWGLATSGLLNTGPAHLLDVQSSTDEQCIWLERVKPSYLLCYPSVLLAICDLLRERGARLADLKQARTFGEVLEQRCRATCEEVLGVKIVDMYSSQEVGYIALQCPEQDHYHVQSENLLVEVLNDTGAPCGPNEIGRVVVTTLHNFAMPLLRYDIGDFAEVGIPCPCGRQLPVLRRILGRQRNLLRTPTGQSRWPVFDRGARPEKLPQFFQFQVVQSSLEEIELLLVRAEDLTADEELFLRRYMQETLGYPFRVSIRRVDEILRSPTGKYEDFVSKLT